MRAVRSISFASSQARLSFCSDSVSANNARPYGWKRTFAVQFVDVRRLDAASFGERVDHERACFGVKRRAFIVRSGNEHRLQFFTAANDAIVVNLVTRLFRQHEPIDDVGSHKRIAGVVLPPTPTTVFVLEAVEPVAPAFDFFCKSLLPRIETDLNSLSVCETITFGRKLDIVCSVQPYGNVVR